MDQAPPSDRPIAQDRVHAQNENGGGPGVRLKKANVGPVLTLIEALLIDARVSQIKAYRANAVPHDRPVGSGLLAAGSDRGRYRVSSE